LIGGAADVKAIPGDRGGVPRNLLFSGDFLDAAGSVGIREVNVARLLIDVDVVGPGLKSTDHIDDLPILHYCDLFTIGLANIDGVRAVNGQSRTPACQLPIFRG
jgi:hypothetical protein